MKFASQLALIVCITCASVYAQTPNPPPSKVIKKAQKTLSKADRFYTAGKYSNALKSLAKYKAISKGHQAFLPAYYLREARYNQALGVLTNFESSLQNALQASVAVFGEATPGHAATLAEVAEVYNQYGYYRLSREYATAALNIINQTDNPDPVIKVRSVLALAEAAIGQGFANEALALLRTHESFIASRAVEKETVATEGKLQTLRVPDAELPERFNSYARLLMLRVAAYGKKGDIDSVDVMHRVGRAWIKSNGRYLGETSLIPVEAYYVYSRSFAEHNDGLVPEGLIKRDKMSDYADQLSELKKRTAPSVPLAHELYLANLDEMLRKDGSSSAKFANLKAEYDRMLSKYFPKNSMMHINLKAVELNTKLAKEQTRNLENAANNILGSSTLPRFHKTRIRSLEFLYHFTLQQRRYTQAESNLNQILEQKKELYGDDSPEYHLTLLTLANFYLDYTNKLAEAGKIYRDSYYGVVEKEIAMKHKDHLEIINHLAAFNELSDNYAEATRLLSKAKDIAQVKYDNEDVVYANELIHMAKLLIKLGNYDRAEDYINEALPIYDLKKNRDDRNIPYQINALETQAKLFGIKGLFDEAEDNLTKTRRMILRAKIPISNELSTAEEMASLFIQLGRYSQTEELLNKLIPEYERLYGKESIRLIDPLINRSRILLAKGDYTEADKIAQRAFAIASKTYGNNSTKTAATQRLLADIYYQLGDFDKAITNYQSALTSLERQFGRQHVDVARTLSQLALAQFYGGYDKALVEKNMFEARDIVADKLGKDNPQYAELLKNLAVLYISNKQYDLAFNSLTIAANIWQQKTGSKRNINAASIYQLTGDVYYQMRNFSKAEEFYNKSIDLYEKFFSASHPEYIKLLSRLSRVYYMNKDYKRSRQRIEQALAAYDNFIKKFFPALSEREKARYWNTIKGDFEFYNTLALGKIEEFRDLSDQVYNYQLLTKAILLNSSIKIRERIMNSTNEELKILFAEWLRKKELLTLSLSMSPQQLAENEIDPSALNQEVEKLERTLSQQSELFGQSFDNKKITYDDVRKSLKANEVAIEMVRFRYFDHNFTDSVIYAAIYIRPDMKSPASIILPDGKNMEGRYFRLYRNSIINEIEDNRSYSIYWEPIQKALGQTATIYLSADGIYNQINLETLLMPNGRYVLDNSNIVLVSNTRDLYLRRVKSTPRADNKASMVGNPAFYVASSRADAPIPQLPGTEKEITQLDYLLKQKGWKTEDYLETQATEERIKQLNNPRVFHVATHGFYKPVENLNAFDELEGNEAVLSQNPLLRTGLLLTGAGDLLGKTEHNFNMDNGILTAYEAMNLNLDQTDLVVLSACETGLGEVEAGEGVYGLQRAFLVAGAKVLIMSMFKVDDEATQKLMLKFYQKWLNTGKMRDSFIEAKKELRNEYPQPIYWGAFLMIGLE
ncbi:MAG: hypothetical protein KatS3mg032_0480 [Cyclobacteriaceae bacterium]|nr:MAG: hypothetical protein KatS3mg032_0480 [Cyclobacteriaceae bacterium]